MPTLVRRARQRRRAVGLGVAGTRAEIEQWIVGRLPTRAFRAVSLVEAGVAGRGASRRGGGQVRRDKRLARDIDPREHAVLNAVGVAAAHHGTDALAATVVEERRATRVASAR